MNEYHYLVRKNANTYIEFDNVVVRDWVEFTKKSKLTNGEIFL